MATKFDHDEKARGISYRSRNNEKGRSVFQALSPDVGGWPARVRFFCLFRQLLGLRNGDDPSTMRIVDSFLCKFHQNLMTNIRPAADSNANIQVTLSSPVLVLSVLVVIMGLGVGVGLTLWN